ncbi:hypothetical protein GGX14DRAFT_560351 [Mycena pura]|uniref:C3H1-type domain-containing protein n=1 Tax=Mycena pura TaxID=153505 RepID=A0AAD6YFV2_9AGAR|nr:hypothetical protein GGX14DRAFT_560351 [Mycena pura]
MSVTKKYRCRYFEEDGRPIPPTCNQGDACRFVHPSDPNWPGRTPFVDTRALNRSSAIKRHKDGGRTIGPHGAESRGLALVPQSDLFLRRKPEGDDQSVRIDRAKPRQKEWDTRVNRDHDNYRERDRHRTSDNRDYAGSNDRMQQGPTKHHGDLTSNGHKRNPNTSVISKIEESVDPKDDFASSSARNSTWGRPGSLLRAPKTHTTLATEIAVPERHSDETKQTERLVGLLSNEVVVATAAHEKEAQKLQTYTDISSALSKISPSAASSVAPALADIMLKHEQCKHRVDEGFTALGGVWEQVFDVFVTEVVRVIDSRLQGAISTIEKEREHAVEELLANTPKQKTKNYGPSVKLRGIINVADFPVARFLRTPVTDTTLRTEMAMALIPASKTF